MGVKKELASVQVQRKVKNGKLFQVLKMLKRHSFGLYSPVPPSIGSSRDHRQNRPGKV
jgi:hypothetical protein